MAEWDVSACAFITSHDIQSVRGGSPSPASGMYLDPVSRSGKLGNQLWMSRGELRQNEKKKVFLTIDCARLFSFSQKKVWIRSLPNIHTLSFLRLSMYIRMGEPFCLTLTKSPFVIQRRYLYIIKMPAREIMNSTDYDFWCIIFEEW